MTRDEYHAWNAAEKVVVTALFGIAYSKPSTSSDPVSDLTGGDRVKFRGLVNWFYEVEFPDGRIGYIPRNIASKESVWRENLRTDTEAILATARSMTGFPYIWAGMSPKGMDCSGYVRAVLFMHDIIIPRDAGPQSRTGKRIAHPDDFVPGLPAKWGERLRNNAAMALWFGRFVRLDHCQGRQFRPGKSPLRRIQYRQDALRLPHSSVYRQGRGPQHHEDQSVLCRIGGIS